MTPVRCERCRATFRLNRPAKGALLGDTDTAVRLAERVSCPACGALDAHWVARRDLVQAGLRPVIIQQVSAEHFILPGVYEARSPRDSKVRRATAGGFRRARVLYADGHQEDLDLAPCPVGESAPARVFA